MTLLTRADAARVARLARLRLGDDELDALAPTLEAITRDFAGLDAYARGLAPAPPAAPGALRADEAETPSPDITDAILAASPRLDAAERALRVPRGSA